MSGMEEFPPGKNSLREAAPTPFNRMFDSETRAKWKNHEHSTGLGGGLEGLASTQERRVSTARWQSLQKPGRGHCHRLRGALGQRATRGVARRRGALAPGILT